MLLSPLFASRARAAGVQARNSESRLEREVAALVAIHELMLTDDQLKAIQPICKDVAVEVPPSTAPAGSKGYRQALQGLRDALANGDEAKVDRLQDKVDSIRENENLDPDTDFPIRESARSKSATVLAMLSTAQVANYISLHADDVPGATDVLLDALNQSRGQSDADYQSLRREAMDQVGLLLAGLDPQATKPVEQKVSDLLDKAHKLSDAEYKSQSDALIAEARKITAGIDPMQGLKFWMQREIAEFLANPESSEAIAERLQKQETKS
jgi:hypothetical protein